MSRGPYMQGERCFEDIPTDTLARAAFVAPWMSARPLSPLVMTATP